MRCLGWICLLFGFLAFANVYGLRNENMYSAMIGFSTIGIIFLIISYIKAFQEHIGKRRRKQEIENREIENRLAVEHYVNSHPMIKKQDDSSNDETRNKWNDYVNQ